MKKLLLLFFFGTMAYAQPNINTPMDLLICETNPGGIAMFDLTVNTPVVLTGLNPDSFTVTYYETMAQAMAGSGAITNPNNFMSANNFIYIRVAEITDSSNYTVASFELMVAPLPVIPNLPAITQCGVIFDLTANSSLISADNIYYYTSFLDAQANMNPIANPQSYVSETSSTVWVQAINNAGCLVVKQQELIVTGGIGEVTFSIDDQTVTFVVVTEGEYQYALDFGPWQDEPTFYNVEYGAHTGMVQDACGNVVTLAFNVNVTPNAPTGQTEQTLTEGATLADLEVEGENILWYDNDGAMPDFPDGMDEPLPLTTVLTDGTTYYASQTIDGVESAQRFGVTVNLVLGVESNIFEKLNCYPNPANNIFTLENVNGIDNISIVNTLGQAVTKMTVNNTAAQVDVSSLSNGVYFVTVTSGSASKTIKVIKE